MKFLEREQRLIGQNAPSSSPNTPDTTPQAPTNTPSSEQSVEQMSAAAQDRAQESAQHQAAEDAERAQKEGWFTNMFEQANDALNQVSTTVQDGFETLQNSPQAKAAQEKFERAQSIASTLAVVGISSETSFKAMKHWQNEEWGKLLGSGLQMFSEAMSNVGDMLANAFSGFGPDVLAFLPESLRAMAGGNRMEFFRGMSTLAEHQIVMFDESAQKPIERPSSTRVLNEYKKRFGPKRDANTPYVSIDKFMLALTDHIISKKADLETRTIDGTKVSTITEAEMVRYASTLTITPDVQPQVAQARSEAPAESSTETETDTDTEDAAADDAESSEEDAETTT